MYLYCVRKDFVFFVNHYTKNSSLSLKTFSDSWEQWIISTFTLLSRYFHVTLWHRGLVVITTAQLHSTKPELRFCAGSNPARGVSEIRDGEDL